MLSWYILQKTMEKSPSDSLSIQIQHQSSRVTGTVDIVDPLIDAASGTFGVRLVLPNPNSKISRITL